MKKAGIIITSAIIAAMISSCAKDYTCTCVYNNTIHAQYNTVDGNGNPIKKDTTYIDADAITVEYKVKKKYSEDPCNSLEEDLTADIDKTNVTCTVE